MGDRSDRHGALLPGSPSTKTLEYMASMPRQIRLSIITVTLNAEAGIQRTAQSIQALKISTLLPRWISIEAVLVDGGSNDHTLQLAEGSGAYERIVSLPGSSLYEAMNHGVQCASGDLVIFLNSGDYYLPGGLEQLLSAGANHLQGCEDHGDRPRDERRLVSGSVVFYTESTYRTLPRARGRSPLSMPAFQPALIYWKSSLISFPFDSRYKVVADYVQLKRLIRAGYSIVHFPIAVTAFSAGGISSSHRRRLEEAYSAACTYSFGNGISRWFALLWLSRGRSLLWGLQTTKLLTTKSKTLSSKEKAL
jgi:glycosyltransferase involved in cell wall biosynthesis